MDNEVPPGLFTAGQEVLIKKAIKELKDVEKVPQKLVNMVWAYTVMIA
jgi:hypothetical protein